MKYTCPVCGYSKLTKPPEDYYICPCCGTEFENDDSEVSHAELRDSWLSAGAPWFSQATRPPPYWNPYVQLLRAGYGHKVKTQNTQSSTQELRLAAPVYRSGMTHVYVQSETSSNSRIEARV